MAPLDLSSKRYLPPSRSLNQRRSPRRSRESLPSFKPYERATKLSRMSRQARMAGFTMLFANSSPRSIRQEPHSGLSLRSEKWPLTPRAWRPRQSEPPPRELKSGTSRYQELSSECSSTRVGLNTESWKQAKWFADE